MIALKHHGLRFKIRIDAACYPGMLAYDTENGGKFTLRIVVGKDIDLNYCYMNNVFSSYD